MFSGKLGFFPENGDGAMPLQAVSADAASAVDSRSG
jgi:hypothetical protein